MGIVDRFIKFVKKLSLTQQLFGIVVTFVVVFSLFFFMFLSWNIDTFVRNQMYGMIKRTQSNIIYNYNLGFGEQVLYGANDPNITHIIYTKDKEIISSNNLPTLTSLLILEIFELTQNQVLATSDYVSDRDFRAMLFTITRINPNTFIATVISNTYRDEFKAALLNSVVNILVIVAGILFLLLMIWVAYIIRPLNQIRMYIEKIRKGEPSELKVDRYDEIGEVASALVAMNEEIKHYNQQREEMIHNISHDLKTPIATIQSYGESIKDGIYPYETLEKSVDVIIEHANRLEKKVKSLLTLNRVGYLASEKLSEDSINMAEVIHQAILSLKVLRPEIKIETDLDDTKFDGLFESWRVVIENLLDNAIRYANSKIIVECKKGVFKIYNDGEPLSEDRINKLFIPYEKGDDGEFGLGLAIVKKVVATYGYHIVATNEATGGVSFTIKSNNDNKKTKKTV